MDEIARGIAAQGRVTEVLTRSRRPAAFDHDRTYPTKVVRMPGHGWVRHHRTYLKLFRPILSRRLRDRVVHAATFELAHALLGGSFSRLVVYLHGLEIAEALTAKNASTNDALFRLSHVAKNEGCQFVANSQRVRVLAAEAGIASERVAVVLPAIDTKRLCPRGVDFRAAWGGTGRPVVLTLARLVPRKGQDMVIRALREIIREVPDALYVIAGRGPDRERLEALARDLGVEAHVRFAEFVDEHDLGDAYASCDVYAMPCRETPEDLEGFGITFLEAGALGKAVVAGRSGGAVDAVLHNETGLLVSPTDPRDIARAILDLLTNPTLRTRLGTAARARVETVLTRDAMVAQLLELTER